MRALMPACLLSLHMVGACKGDELLIDRPQADLVNEDDDWVLREQAPDDDALPPTDPTSPPDDPQEPTEPATCGFGGTTFRFPEDELSCSGPQFVRFDDRFDLFVGVSTCQDTGEVRVYLSREEQGPFLPAADTAGHGQDHCQLVNPAFTFQPNSDDITSGGCVTCSTGTNLPLENRSVWVRANIDEQFTFVPQSPTWSHQTSRLRCGIDVDTCETGAPTDPTDRPREPVVQPEVPCNFDNEAVEVVFNISAANMRGASVDEPGSCIARLYFTTEEYQTSYLDFADGDSFDFTVIESTANSVYDYENHTGVGAHYGTLRFADGTTEIESCSVSAYCDPNTLMARAVSYTW
jgi:hypothetical protein